MKTLKDFERFASFLKMKHKVTGHLKESLLIFTTRSNFQLKIFLNRKQFFSFVKSNSEIEI